MKPPQFAYADPTTIEETLGLLGQHGADGKILAGGQSFVPLLNFRMARPETLIDINRVTGLDQVETGDNGLTIGALTRQQRLLENHDIARGWPLLTEAAGFIGHRSIRNRGTVGGSLAHADPSAELPGVAVTLDARMTVRGQNGEREVAARDFFVDFFTTAVEPDELLTRIAFPSLPARTGTSFQEVSRRHGDFAMVAAAALVTLDESDRVADARLTLVGVGAVPVAVDIAGPLAGQEPVEGPIADAVSAGLADLDPLADHHASAEYRRSVAAALSRRALTAAAARAREGGNA